MAGRQVGVRWTIGDVSDRGFGALRLSLLGARRVFGEEAPLVVCVNTVSVEEARQRTGKTPGGVAWLGVTRADVPGFVSGVLDRAMAEGAGWKLAPVRLFPDRYEIALDNDCVLWACPGTIARWLEGPEPGRCVMSADVRRALGCFGGVCGPGAYNSGIRGLPPGYDYEETLQRALGNAERIAGGRVTLRSELDEQGWQAAAVGIDGPPLVVGVEEVSLCSPCWPLSPRPGRCGAHFVGLNSRRLGWSYYGRPAEECVAEHFDACRGRVERLVGLAVCAEDERACVWGEENTG